MIYFNPTFHQSTYLYTSLYNPKIIISQIDQCSEFQASFHLKTIGKTNKKKQFKQKKPLFHLFLMWIFKKRKIKKKKLNSTHKENNELINFQEYTVNKKKTIIRSSNAHTININIMLIEEDRYVTIYGVFYVNLVLWLSNFLFDWRQSRD